MFGPLIVCYLFLGGTGAGACFVLAVLGLFVPRDQITIPTEPRRALFSRRVHTPTLVRAPQAYRRLFGSGYLVGVVVLVLGMVCLLVDVGRLDRVDLLFTNPTLSFIAVGVWVLVGCVLMAAFLALVWGGLVKRCRATVVRVLEVLLLFVSLAVMVYAGLLLQSLPAVPLWTSPWLPVLFVISSLSCGIALVLASMQFTSAARSFSAVLRRLALADAVIIVLEVLVAIFFVATALGSVEGGLSALGNVLESAADSSSSALAASSGLASGTEVASAASVQSLLVGQYAWLFWVGFGFVGLVVPLLFDIVLSRCGRAMPLFTLATAACVLVGGFVLRFCVVEAGMHPVLAFTALG